MKKQNFRAESFTQDIEDWDVSNVTDMRGMFRKSGLARKKPKWYRWWKTR